MTTQDEIAAPQLRVADGPAAPNVLDGQFKTDQPSRNWVPNPRRFARQNAGCPSPGLSSQRSQL